MPVKEVYLVMAKGTSKPWTDLNGHTHQDYIVHKTMEGKGAKVRAMKYVKAHNDLMWPMQILKVIQ